MQFTKRPKKRPDPNFGGQRLTWRTRDGLYHIDQFTSGSGLFIAVLDLGMGRQRVIASRRTLAAAQRACAKHEGKPNPRHGRQES